jgi:hypothetical protein
MGATIFGKNPSTGAGTERVVVPQAVLRTDSTPKYVTVASEVLTCTVYESSEAPFQYRTS